MATHSIGRDSKTIGINMSIKIGKRTGAALLFHVHYNNQILQNHPSAVA